MRKLALLVLVVGVAVVGSQAVSAQPGKGKVVASATGAGHVTQNAKLRTFSFTAREYADGTVKGQAQLRNRGDTNTPIHVRDHVLERRRRRGSHDRLRLEDQDRDAAPDRRRLEGLVLGSRQRPDR